MVVVGVVHRVVGALNRIKSNVSRRSSLWTGSTFVNRFKHYSRPFGIIINVHTSHAPCRPQGMHVALFQTNCKPTACWKQNILKLLLTPSNVQSKYSRSDSLSTYLAWVQTPAADSLPRGRVIFQRTGRWFCSKRGRVSYSIWIDPAGIDCTFERRKAQLVHVALFQTNGLRLVPPLGNLLK